MFRFLGLCDKIESIRQQSERGGVTLPIQKKPLPIGVDNFEDLIRNDYYYVDKTMLVKQVLDLKGKVNLFTRPRRFGKTLNLSMLRYFLKIQEMRQKMLPRENYLMD